MAQKSATDLRIIQTEARLKRECKDRNALDRYVEPPSNETTNQRTVRRRKIHQSLLNEDEDEQRREKKRLDEKKRRDAIRNGEHIPTPRAPTKQKMGVKENCTGHQEGYCDKAMWPSPPYCKDVTAPQKKSIEITGKGGHPVYASAKILDAEYISSGITSLDKKIYYCQRDLEGVDEHIYTIRFNNLKEDGMRFACTIDVISRCEIRINGTVIGSMKDCVRADAELHPSQSDYLIINHQFMFEHGATPWGWHESFTLKLSYGPVPKDITAELQAKLKSQNTTKLDAFSYALISRKGISSIEFTEICFRETSMQWKDHVYFIAWKSICEKKEGKAMSNKEAEQIWCRNEKEENRKKHWMCINGNKLCHEYSYAFCGLDCERHYQQGSRSVSKKVNTLCLSGYEICHNGILQCPDCRKANCAKNKPRWKCMNYSSCHHASPSFEEMSEHERGCLWKKHNRINKP